jgi:CRP-like cAMP-binding protein
VLGGEEKTPILSMGRGDALGEMGLVRARPRTADVVVVRDAEYLVLDEGFLQRLQRRHPRIAAKVFLNLTRILSDRLERTTDQLVDERSHASESALG